MAWGSGPGAVLGQGLFIDDVPSRIRGASGHHPLGGQEAAAPAWKRGVGHGRGVRGQRGRPGRAARTCAAQGPAKPQVERRGCGGARPTGRAAGRRRVGTGGPTGASTPVARRISQPGHHLLLASDIDHGRRGDVRGVWHRARRAPPLLRPRRVGRGQPGVRRVCRWPHRHACPARAAQPRTAVRSSPGARADRATTRRCGQVGAGSRLRGR